MLITAEYDPIEEREALREEAWEYGHEEGHAAGHAEGLKEGHAEGHAVGHAVGLKEGRAEGLEAMITAARNALAKGLPVETVQEITGLETNVIEQLKYLKGL